MLYVLIAKTVSTIFLVIYETTEATAIVTANINLLADSATEDFS